MLIVPLEISAKALAAVKFVPLKSALNNAAVFPQFRRRINCTQVDPLGINWFVVAR
jgi:hypothetical protein